MLLILQRHCIDQFMPVWVFFTREVTALNKYRKMLPIQFFYLYFSYFHICWISVFFHFDLTYNCEKPDCDFNQSKEHNFTINEAVCTISYFKPNYSLSLTVFSGHTIISVIAQQQTVSSQSPKFVPKKSNKNVCMLVCNALRKCFQENRAQVQLLFSVRRQH